MDLTPFGDVDWEKVKFGVVVVLAIGFGILKLWATGSDR